MTINTGSFPKALSGKGKKNDSKGGKGFQSNFGKGQKLVQARTKQRGRG
jgi:hypothetical protein